MDPKLENPGDVKNPQPVSPDTLETQPNLNSAQTPEIPAPSTVISSTDLANQSAPNQEVLSTSAVNNNTNLANSANIPTQPVQPNSAAKLSESVKEKVKNLLTRWYFWGMIGAGIFGIIGIVLGVYSLIGKAALDQEISRLQTELDAANELVVKYGTQLGEKVNELGKPGNTGNSGNVDEVLDGLASATKNYIYVGEWGIKIKIPKGLKNVSYAFRSNLAESGETTEDGKAKVITTETLCLSALLDEMRYTPEDFSLKNNPEGLGCLVRSTDKDTENYLGYVGKVGEYYYTYARSDVDVEDEQESQWWEQASVLISEALNSKKELTSFKNN